MTVVRLVVVAALACLSLGVSPVHARDVKSSVVEVFTVYNEYDFYRPWQMKGKQNKNGSGCIIEGNRILTNAHVVADQTFIQVQRAGQVEKFVAKVKYVEHECDLAILVVPDPRFFEDTEPLRLGPLPEIQQQVAVYGFPRGGSKVAITQGVVSRVESIVYSHSEAQLLGCQIDAPINPGSSGGPVVSDGKLVGIAFQSMSGENIGYMVPPPVIEHFMRDVEDGSVHGFPSLGFGYQKMENPDMRRAYHMQDSQSGILVNRAFPLSPCRGVLDSGDVVMAIDGCPIANDGTIEFRKGERTSFEYVAQQKQIGDSLSLTVLRRGAARTLRVRLSIPSNAWQLVPRHLYDTPPRYLIVGGLVFVPLTANLLQTWGPTWTSAAPRNLVYYYSSEPDTNRSEVIVMAQLLSDEMNVGYDDNVFSVVSKVNGRSIRDMPSLVQAFETNQGEFHDIVDDEGYRIVVGAKQALDTKARILQRYRIEFDRSEGLGGVGKQ